MINQQNIPQIQNQVGKEKLKRKFYIPIETIQSFYVLLNIHLDQIQTHSLYNINYQLKFRHLKQTATPKTTTDNYLLVHGQSLEVDFPPFIFISEILLQLPTTRRAAVSPEPK